MINPLDFKSIKRSVTMESVLRHYQVQLRRSGKHQYRGCCPIHRGDGHDAFHVNSARNIFHCFACGAGGTVLDFVAGMEACSLFEAAQRLQAMTCSTEPLSLTPNGKELVTERRKVSSPLKFKLTGIDYAHPYLAERGITQKTAIEFGVGFYAGPGLMHGRLVIPIHNADGELGPIADGPWIRRNRGTASRRLLPNRRSFSICTALAPEGATPSSWWRASSIA
jgi:hypothetical protein